MASVGQGLLSDDSMEMSSEEYAVMHPRARFPYTSPRTQLALRTLSDSTDEALMLHGSHVPSKSTKSPVSLTGRPQKSPS